MTRLFALTTLTVALLSGCGSPSQASEERAPALYSETNIPDSLGVAYFAGGCFWCTEAQFERIQGVIEVVSGYSGGPEVNPKYGDVARGKTGHAETIRIVYDPDGIDYATLLDIFFVGHDPTTLNRQGPDKGPHYRSAIFFQTPEEEAMARKKIKELDASGIWKDPVVTEVTAFDVFYGAEDYHQDYYDLNPRQPYIYNVSRPKVEKVEKAFKHLLKDKYLG